MCWSRGLWVSSLWTYVVPQGSTRHSPRETIHTFRLKCASHTNMTCSFPCPPHMQDAAVSGPLGLSQFHPWALEELKGAYRRLGYKEAWL